MTPKKLDLHIGDWLLDLDPEKVTGVNLGWHKEEPLRVSFLIVYDGCIIEIRGKKEELKVERARLINAVKKS